jgi:hypothetical protein
MTDALQKATTDKHGWTRIFRGEKPPRVSTFRLTFWWVANTITQVLFS